MVLGGDTVKLSQCFVVRNVIDFKDLLWRQIFVLGVDFRVSLPGYFKQFAVEDAFPQFDYKTQVTSIQKVIFFSYREGIVGPWEVSLVPIGRIFGH